MSPFCCRFRTHLATQTCRADGLHCALVLARQTRTRLLALGLPPSVSHAGLFPPSFGRHRLVRNGLHRPLDVRPRHRGGPPRRAARHCRREADRRRAGGLVVRPSRPQGVCGKDLPHQLHGNGELVGGDEEEGQGPRQRHRKVRFLPSVCSDKTIADALLAFNFCTATTST